MPQTATLSNLRQLFSRYFPADFGFGIGSGSKVTPDILSIGGLEDFDPLAFQIHEVDMELEHAVLVAGADSVTVMHDSQNQHVFRWRLC
jgi:hypothetical protein